MTPYYVMLAIIVFCIFLENSAQTIGAKKKIFRLALIPVFVLIAFKGANVGSDTSRYIAMFQDMAECQSFDQLDAYNFDRLEIGYKYFILILSRLGSDQLYLLVPVGLIVAYSLYKFIWETASNKSLALYLFVTFGYFQFTMSGIRQTIALSIILLSFKYIKERKIYWFGGYVFAAFLFHKSSVFFFPAYYISNWVLDNKKTSYMFIAMIVLFFFGDKLLLSAADIMKYDYGVEKSESGYEFFALMAFITYIIVKNRAFLISRIEDSSLFININYFAMATWVVRMISRTAERVSYYFMPYTYIAIERYISSQSPKNKFFYTLIAIIAFGFLCLKRLSGAEEFSNFTFYFE